MGLKLNDTRRLLLGAGSIALFFATGNPQFLLLGVGLILSALASTPKREVINRSITHRGPTEPRRVIYGIHRVGGILSFLHLTNNNQNLQMVIALSGHEVEEIGGTTSASVFPNRVYVNGQPVQLDGSGLAKAPPTKILLDPSDVDTANNKFLFTAHNFETNQRVKFTEPGGATLPGNVDEGQPYFIIRLDANEYQITKRFVTQISPSHVINLTSTGSGDFEMELDSEVIDYTGHLRVEKRHGLDSQAALTDLVTAVNDTGIWSTAHRLRGISYAWVELKWNRDIFPQGIPNITFDIKGKKIWDPRIGGGPDTDIAWTTNPSLIVIDYLMDSDYGMDTAVEKINQTKLISAANICEETVVLALPQTGDELRYEAAGSFKMDKKPSSIIKDLLSSMGGKLVQVGGKWEIYAGAHIVATETYDEGDLSAGLKIQTLIDRRDNFNIIRGTFVSPLDNWQPTSYPERSSAGAISGDQGKENPKELDFPWTLSPSTAQRLAKIELNKILETLAVDIQGKLATFRSQPPDSILLDNVRMGWSGKEFEIIDAGLVISEEGAVNYRMKLRETNSGIYDWTGATDETDFVTTRNSNFPSPFAIEAPTSLVLTSGTNDLFIRLDGTIFSRIKAVWVAPLDEFVISGGWIEVQFKKSADSDFLEATTVVGSVIETFILDVEDGVSYDVRIRGRNSIGATSDYLTVSNHVVIGKTAPPQDVVTFSAVQSEANVVLNWSQVTDQDLSGYDIRFGKRSPTLTFSSANLLTLIQKGTSHTTAAIPPGDWTIFIKARDTTGNVSVNAKSVNIVVTTFNPVIKDDDVAIPWLGVRTEITQPSSVPSKFHFVKHYTGVIVPESQQRAEFIGSGGDNFDVFDNYVQNPFPESVYTDKEFDLGREGDVRAFADFVGSLGPEPGVGEVVSAKTQIRTALDDGIFSTWQDITTSQRITARKVQYRLVSDNTEGISFFLSFVGSLDVEPRTEGAVDVIVSASGSVISFATPFFVLPRIKITSKDSAARMVGFTDRSETEFTIHVFNDAGMEVGGTVDWEASTFSVDTVQS